MKLLTKYVLREFLVPLGYCLAGFVSIYVLFELFGSFSRLVEAKLPFATVVQYFCGYLAPFFHYLAPAAMMLATLYTMWSFCRHSEIVAMRSSGVSFLAIVKPLLAVAVLMAGFVAWVNESYVPRHAQWAKRLRAASFSLEKVAREDKIAYRNTPANRFWTADALADDTTAHLLDVKVTVDRDSGVRLMAVAAERADYVDGEWWFTNPTVRHYGPDGSEVATPTPELDAMGLRVFPEFREKPSDIALQNQDWRYNSVRSKRRFIRTHRDLDAQQRRDFTYDAWAQALSPLACLVITLFAIPAGIASGRQSVFKGVLGALGLYFSFYGLVIGCWVLESRWAVPPVAAAVLPYVVFLAVGLRAFHRQR